MNEDIIKKIAGDNNIKPTQIKSVLKLLEEGNTIPFIARYRKEATGSLDEANTVRVMNILKELNEAGKTIILVTHDEKIKQMAGRVIDL